MIQGFLWITLAVVAAATLVNVLQNSSLVTGLIEQTPNLLLCAAVLVALWLNHVNRFTAALWLVLGLILAIVSASLLVGGLQVVGLFLYFIPLVLAGLLLGRFSLYLTGSIALLAPLASTWLTRQDLLLVEGYATRSDWTPVLQYGLVLAMVTFFLDRFGSTLNDALATAVEREIELKEQVEERKAVEARLMEAQSELELLNESLEERVAERTERLERANRELETFGWSVSHDLRTPLRGIAGFAEILREEYGEVLGETGRSYLQRILKASGRMDGLIADLLDFSRLAEREVRRDEVDLVEPAAELAEELNRLNGQSGRRPVRFTADGPLPVRGDAQLLEILLGNLLSNAWNYMGDQPEPQVRLTAGTEAGETVYCVSDNGSGFAMEYAEKIFEPFHRLDADNETGTGIGLATARRIVQRHGGRIWAKSAPGEGASFCFTIPE